MERTSGNGDEQHQTITMKTEEIIGLILRQKQMTLSTAESCTGGTIASMLTSVPGCSDYFLGSVVSYCNEVKRQVLGVSKEDLDKAYEICEEVFMLQNREQNNYSDSHMCCQSSCGSKPHL